VILAPLAARMALMDAPFLQGLTLVHSSAERRLNVSAFCGIGDASRGLSKGDTWRV